MTIQKKCSGTATIVNWTLPANSCIYQLTLTIDGIPITNTVAVNNGLTDNQVSTLLNTNRTGNTSGTISTQTVGPDLIVTITDVVLTSTSAGVFSYTISGTGFPCGDFNIPLPSALTCTLIPANKKKKRSGSFAISESVCFNKNYIEQIFPNSCRDGGLIYSSTRVPYVFSHIDANGNCCFKIKR